MSLLQPALQQRNLVKRVFGWKIHTRITIKNGDAINASESYEKIQ